MTIIAPSVALTNRHGEILLLLRHPSKILPLHWCIPGGKLNEGEFLRNGAIRETKEETGLDLEGRLHGTPLEIFHIGDVEVPLYHYEYIETPYVVLEQGSFVAYGWFRIKDGLQTLGGTPLTPSTRRCFQLLGA